MTQTISGYASVFGIPDLSGDEVRPGAFTQSLKSAAISDVKMLYQHDFARPIGRWRRIVETEKGLWVEGCLTPRVRLAEEVAALVADGALDGLSIGFRVRRAEAARGRVRRRLVDLELVEISVVTFPMQPQARIASHHRNRTDGLAPSLRSAGDRLKALAS